MNTTATPSGIVQEFGSVSAYVPKDRMADLPASAKVSVTLEGSDKAFDVLAAHAADEFGSAVFAPQTRIDGTLVEGRKIAFLNQLVTDVYPSGGGVAGGFFDSDEMDGTRYGKRRTAILRGVPESWTYADLTARLASFQHATIMVIRSLDVDKVFSDGQKAVLTRTLAEQGQEAHNALRKEFADRLLSRIPDATGDLVAALYGVDLNGGFPGVPQYRREEFTTLAGAVDIDYRSDDLAAILSGEMVPDGHSFGVPLLHAHHGDGVMA